MKLGRMDSHSSQCPKKRKKKSHTHNRKKKRKGMVHGPCDRNPQFPLPQCMMLTSLWTPQRCQHHVESTVWSPQFRFHGGAFFTENLRFFSKMCCAVHAHCTCSCEHAQASCSHEQSGFELLMQSGAFFALFRNSALILLAVSAHFFCEGCLPQIGDSSRTCHKNLLAFDTVQSVFSKWCKRKLLR